MPNTPHSSCSVSPSNSKSPGQAGHGLRFRCYPLFREPCLAACDLGAIGLLGGLLAAVLPQGPAPACGHFRITDFSCGLSCTRCGDHVLIRDKGRNNLRRIPGSAAGGAHGQSSRAGCGMGTMDRKRSIGDAYESRVAHDAKAPPSARSDRTDLRFSSRLPTTGNS